MEISKLQCLYADDVSPVPMTETTVIAQSN
jgi:hypothetical protein